MLLLPFKHLTESLTTNDSLNMCGPCIIYLCLCPKNHFNFNLLRKKLLLIRVNKTTCKKTRENKQLFPQCDI